MGNLDSVPLISQAKSGIEAYEGNVLAARTTQYNFRYRNTFPVASQLVSAEYAIEGEMTKARELQEEFALNLVRIIDSVPIAGHIKGGIHYMLGDVDRGNRAMVSASRSTAIATAAAIGKKFGWVTTIILGLLGAMTTDGFITAGLQLASDGVNSKFNKSDTYGYITIFTEMCNGLRIWELFELIVQLIADILLSLIYGSMSRAIMFMYAVLFALIWKTFSLICCWFSTKTSETSTDRKREFKGTGTYHDLNNHSNQLNPNNAEYWRSRSFSYTP